MNTAMNGAAQAASLLSTLVFFPLLVRAFGTAEYGIYVIATAVTGVALMFDFGIGASTIRLVANRVSLRDVEGFAFVVSSALGLLLLLGAFIAAAIAGIGLLAGGIFNVTPGQADLLRRLLFIGAGMQLWYWPTSVAPTVLSGLERYDLVARTSLLSTVGGVVVIGLVLLLHGGPVMLMFLGALVMVATSIVNIVTMLAVRPAGNLRVLPSRPVAQEILSGGVPIFVGALAQFFNREQADRLIVGVVIGPAAVAVYEVAAKLSMLVMQVTVLATSAVLPVASGMAARGDERALRGLFLRGSRYISLAIAPVIVVLLVLAGPFIQVWFGPEFGASIPVAALLILAQVFVPLYQIGDPILIAKARFGRWVRWSLALALLNVTVSVALVGSLGLVGVAVGTLASGLVELPLYAAIILDETSVPAREWLRRAGVAYLILPLSALPALALAATPLAQCLPGIAVIATVAVLVYWAGAYGLLLDAEERLLVKARLRGLASWAMGGEGARR